MKDRHLFMAVLALAALLLASCRTRTVYIPFETVRLDSVAVRDTVFRTRLVPYKDSVSVRDTASFLSNPYAYSYASLGAGMLRHSLGIWPQAAVTVRVPYFIDRYVRIEVPKPYPVERGLTRWQRFKMDFGEFCFGYLPLSLLIIIRLVRAKKK